MNLKKNRIKMKNNKFPQILRNLKNQLINKLIKT